MNMKAKKVKQKSIFSRLVSSYVVFLFATIFLYLVVTVGMLVYFGNGSFGNASPQAVIKPDGTITDTEVLNRIGGWVEELDKDGNVINVVGDKKTDKYSYGIDEMSRLLDMGYMEYNSNGVMISQHESSDEKPYSASVRHIGNPSRIFLVFYPSNMVSYKISYLITNENGSNFTIFIVVFSVLFMIEIFGISFYLKRHIDNPLKLLMHGMEEVSEGKRDVMLDYVTDKEFDAIRNRFNLMADKLRESEDKRHQIEQSRNQMLFELAHDLKNPVASIKGSITALLEGLVPEEKKADYYKTIDMKVERISTLTDDMNISIKMESDDYKINPERKDICELVRTICAEFYEDITSTGKEFDISIPDEEFYADVDSQLFKRVISNLLANANKYNTSGNTVGIDVSHDNGAITIEVADDGEPIAKDFVPKMFDAFSRGDTTRKTDGGTGLGLAIAKKIAIKHKAVLSYDRTKDRNLFVFKLKEASA